MRPQRAELSISSGAIAEAGQLDRAEARAEPETSVNKLMQGGVLHFVVSLGCSGQGLASIG
jgi:hypothetical protein